LPFSDIDDATVIGITEEVIAQAVGLLEQFPLRSADALPIACASEWSTDLFVSADDRQCKAARARGLRVEAIRV
jgi:predicted nucleic acid-binding protein